MREIMDEKVIVPIPKYLMRMWEVIKSNDYNPHEISKIKKKKHWMIENVIFKTATAPYISN